MRQRNGLTAGAGKRLAKRSIIGTRVCAPAGDDGKLCAGIIAAVKTAADGSETGYSIRFDDGTGSRREYRATELVGPGFRTLSDLRLMAGQRVYITFNGREISGDVVVHRPDTEEVRVSITPPGHEVSVGFFFFANADGRHGADNAIVIIIIIIADFCRRSAKKK